MINYSFIIPHHNCPELLNRCLNSIPQRDDIEIIVVDDNSNEGKKPNVTRSDIQIILLNKNQSNGAGKARNVGLENAGGKWLVFADADDYFSSYLTSFLDKYSNDNETDIVYLNACQFDENGNETRYAITDDLIENYLNGKTYSEMNLRYSLWTPWSRMVKRHVVVQNNIVFDELPAGNDVMFGLKCSKYSKSIKAEKTIVYKYYKHSKGSNTDRAREIMHDSLLDLVGRHIQIQKEVGYKYRLDFISEFIHQVKNHNLSVLQAYEEYQLYLKKYNISMVSDVRHLLCRHLFK